MKTLKGRRSNNIIIIIVSRAMMHEVGFTGAALTYGHNRSPHTVVTNVIDNGGHDCVEQFGFCMSVEDCSVELGLRLGLEHDRMMQIIDSICCTDSMVIRPFG